MKLLFQNYVGSYTALNGVQDMDIRMLDLCRYTMQVGYRNRGAYWKASWLRHIELFFMVLANVTEQRGRLQLKDGYFELDQSEKVCVSYQIGQGLTKAVADRYLKIPWVSHFKTMKNAGYYFKPDGNIKIIIKNDVDKGSEPDLVGFDIFGQPHLLESKGSSAYHPNDKTVQTAINQVSRFQTIDKIPFATRSACIFNFRNDFHGKIIDPPTGDNEGSTEDSSGLMLCLYDHYYDFFLGRNTSIEERSVKLYGRDWVGTYFSFGERTYFWGLDRSYEDFLEKEVFSKYALNKKQDLTCLKRRLDQQKIREHILSFFQEQDTFDRSGQDIPASVGTDGFILCQILK